MKLSFSLLLLLNTFLYRNGQATDVYITTSRQDIRTVSIKTVLKSESITHKLSKKAALLKPGRFVVSVNMQEPQYVYLVMNDSLSTESFFLDNKAAKTDITINEDLTLAIKNPAAQDEYITAYHPALEGIDKEIINFFTGKYRESYIKHNGQIPDSINTTFDSVRSQLRERRFRIMKDYITRHPASYVAMWKLLEEIEIYGYKKTLAESFTSFSERLKASAIGRMVEEKLTLVRTLEPGHIFPDFSVRDMQSKAVQLKTALQGKYVLVDFWFSSCYPCIEQFPALKELHDQYTRDQFTIVLISVDKLNDISKWKQAITKYGLPFAHYLDVGGTVSYAELSIVKFPTNFLLDSNGKIIAKDITPQKLKLFLEREL